MSYLPGNDANKLAPTKKKWMCMSTTQYKVLKTQLLFTLHAIRKLDHDDTPTGAAPFILYITNYGTQN